jgi:hypothetical protein
MNSVVTDARNVFRFALHSPRRPHPMAHCTRRSQFIEVFTEAETGFSGPLAGELPEAATPHSKKPPAGKARGRRAKE